MIRSLRQVYGGQSAVNRRSIGDQGFLNSSLVYQRPRSGCTSLKSTTLYGEMLPPTIAIFKEVSTSDFFLVQTPDHDAYGPIPKDEEISAKSTIEEDPSYYFQDVIFLVEGTFFKVPRHHFEHSVFFRDMFSAETDKGWTKEKPFHVDGLSKHDFVAFLKIICPRNVFQPEDLSFEDWVSVLKLSTLWNFEEARKCAINNLPFTDFEHPVTRIELAMRYKVRQWYFPALQKLATQQYSFETQDVERLGLNFAMKVVELRGRVQGFERAMTVTSATRKPVVPVLHVTDFIGELFPAAIMKDSEVYDSRSWDPLSLSFLSWQAEPPALAVTDNGIPAPPPVTPPSMPDMKLDPSLDFYCQANDSVPAVTLGPFGSPTCVSKPLTALPSPTSHELLESSGNHRGSKGGGWKVKKRP